MPCESAESMNDHNKISFGDYLDAGFSEWVDSVALYFLEKTIVIQAEEVSLSKEERAQMDQEAEEYANKLLETPGLEDMGEEVCSWCSNDHA